MAFVWTPEPREPLFEGLETTKDLILSVSVGADETDAEATPPKVVFWSLIGDDAITAKAQATQTDDTLTLFFKDLEGAIPIIGIEYCFPSSAVINTANNWGDLPDDPIQVVSYRKSADSPKILTLSVTAIDDDDNSETVAYSIMVQGEYSSDRDKLLAVLADNT